MRDNQSAPEMFFRLVNQYHIEPFCQINNVEDVNIIDMEIRLLKSNFRELRKVIVVKMSYQLINK